MSKTKDSKMQGTLHDWTRQEENNQRCTVQSLRRHGDNMTARVEGEGILRLCNLNKRGIDIGDGFNISPNMEIMKNYESMSKGTARLISHRVQVIRPGLTK